MAHTVLDLEFIWVWNECQFWITHSLLIHSIFNIIEKYLNLKKKIFLIKLNITALHIVFEVASS